MSNVKSNKGVTMSQQILQALNAKYVAQRLEAIANLNNYLANPAGIGEHPNLI